MCRTHCLLSEVLWLFQQLLGASGPTGGVIYYPSGLGTGSGSKGKKRSKYLIYASKHKEINQLH